MLALFQCVAVGDNWVAAATNKRHLRLFTSSGMQREVLSLPGAVVAMSGGIEKLAIVYQTPPCELQAQQTQYPLWTDAGGER